MRWTWRWRSPRRSAPTWSSPTTPTPTGARSRSRTRTGGGCCAATRWARCSRTSCCAAASRGVYASSIVSSSLLGRLAAAHGQSYVETLTGFKWIARVDGLAFGYEEALGYCVAPDLVRDKDGVSALLRVVRAGRGAQGRGPHPGGPARRHRPRARAARHRPAVGAGHGPLPDQRRHGPAAHRPAEPSRRARGGAGRRPRPGQRRPAADRRAALPARRRRPGDRPAVRHRAEAQGLPGGRRPGRATTADGASTRPGSRPPAGWTRSAPTSRPPRVCDAGRPQTNSETTKARALTAPARPPRARRRGGRLGRLRRGGRARAWPGRPAPRAGSPRRSGRTSPARRCWPGRPAAQLARAGWCRGRPPRASGAAGPAGPRGRSCRCRCRRSGSRPPRG